MRLTTDTPNAGRFHRGAMASLEALFPGFARKCTEDRILLGCATREDEYEARLLADRAEVLLERTFLPEHIRPGIRPVSGSWRVYLYQGKSEDLIR